MMAEHPRRQSPGRPSFWGAARGVSGVGLTLTAGGGLLPGGQASSSGP